MRAGSFAAVARVHEVDPSSISRTIAILEDELGFRLFLRTTRRLAATEAGTLYFERTQPIIDEMERVGQEARDIVAEPAGRLRVTASVSFGHTVLVPLLPRLRSAYPDLSVDLILTDAVLDLITEKIDVAVRLGPRIDTGLIGTHLMRTRYHVCASPAYLKSAPKPRAPPRSFRSRLPAVSLSGLPVTMALPCKDWRSDGGTGQWRRDYFECLGVTSRRARWTGASSPGRLARCKRSAEWKTRRLVSKV